MRASSLIYPFLIAFGLMQVATAQEPGTLYPLPPQTEDTAWPTQDWPVRNILTDTQQSDLYAILDPIFATEIGEGLGETRAILVIRNGAIIHERYRDGFTTDTRHVSWSVAKSITSALVGRAVQTGLIASIDDPMPGPFTADDPRSAISWRHWLQMLDGLDYVELEATGLDDSD
ncbi:MAG: serine hydrolase, partial [Pseudomonadota bacterium]